MTLCPNLAVSGLSLLPNHAHTEPVRGGNPIQQDPRSHSGVPQFDENTGLFQIGSLMPPFSNPPSMIMSEGAQVGVGGGSVTIIDNDLASASQVERLSISFNGSDSTSLLHASGCQPGGWGSWAWGGLSHDGNLVRISSDANNLVPDGPPSADWMTSWTSSIFRP